MSTILPGLDTTNRLVEAVGSAALFQDVATASPVGQLGGGLDLLGAVADADSVSTATIPTAIDPLALGGLLGDGLPDVLDVANLGDITGGPTGQLLTLAGPGATAQPVLEPINELILDVHVQLEALAHEVGLGYTVHGVTELGETIGLGYIGVPGGPGGTTNLVTDVVNLPGNVLNGNLDGALQDIGNDLTHTVDAANTALTNVLGGPDPTNPVPELVSSIGHALQTLPLLSLNGGNNSGNGGILGGVIGDITHSSSGHLIDLDIGPSQAFGQQINLLSSGDENTHAISLNVIDVGPNGPHLLDAGVLTNPGITAPLSLGGTDVLGSLGGNGVADGVLGALGGGAAGGLLGSLGGSGLPAVPDVAHIVPAGLPLPAITDVAGLAGHGILDLHAVHII